jgi:hypothetical protein
MRIFMKNEPRDLTAALKFYCNEELTNAHSAVGEYHVQNVNNQASRLKSIVNHSLRGVSIKYLQSYANWFKLNSSGSANIDLNQAILKNKSVFDIHKT